MRKLSYPIAAIAIMAICSFTVFQSADLKIADNYSVKFDGGDPSGEFKGLKGTINFDPSNPESAKFDVTIDVATINTGNGMKNTHAMSEKWLDAAKYPVIRFSSKTVTKTATGFEAKGTLDMHGVQKDVVLPFTFADNVFKGTLEVNRMDYNVNTAEPKHGGADFKIAITVPVTK
jgi:polyisoprenoid-binding protein YceI